MNSTRRNRSADRTGIKVLYMSGHTEAAIQQRSAYEPGAVLIDKPFTLAQLAGRMWNHVW